MKRLIDCREFDRNQSAYLDGQVPVELRLKLNTHLTACTRCRERSRAAREMRGTMLRMPLRSVPARLTTRLYVSASRELADRRQNISWWQRRRERLALWAGQAMKPFALPAAGGVLSAILLFGTVGPYLLLPGAAQSAIDVPTGLYTEASVYSTAPIGFDGEEIEVELNIDEDGRMIDYTVPDQHYAKLLKSQQLRRSLESHLLLARFNPPKMFGQKTGGKVRLTFRSSSIDVRG